MPVYHPALHADVCPPDVHSGVIVYEAHAPDAATNDNATAPTNPPTTRRHHQPLTALFPPTTAHSAAQAATTPDSK